MKYKIIMFIVSAISACSYAANETKSLIWEEYPQLPPPSGVSVQHGVASPFAGTYKGVVIVAGGSNFSDRPLAEGGTKCFHDDIFVLTQKDGVPEWLSGFKLDKPVAGGASVSLDAGVLCMGGSGYAGIYGDVFLLIWNEKKRKVEIQNYPSLPFPMTNMGAALVENTVYLAGGLTTDGLSNKFLKLDLSKQNSPDFGWEILPDFPGDGRQFPVMLAQNDDDGSAVFLFSGLDSPGKSGQVVIHTDGLKYSPKTQAWQILPEIRIESDNKKHLLYAGAGVKSGKNEIICMGGANYEVLSEVFERERASQRAKQSGDTKAYQECLEKSRHYQSQAPEWYRLNTDILTYNTETGQWKKIGKLPFPAFVCAAVVEWKNGWLVINGEIKPGVRTPKVYYGELKNGCSENSMDDLVKIKSILESKKPSVWLFTGNSITQGAKHTHGQRAYPEIFAERIRWEMGRSMDVIINTAISGHTGQQILDDFEQRITRFQPDVVLLMAGTNDACEDWRYVNIEQFESNLMQIIKKIREIHAIPVLLTPNSIITDKSPERKNLEQYVNKIREISAKKQVILVDNWMIWNTELQEKYQGAVYKELLNDPIHPNGLGHKEIAIALFKTLSIFDTEASTCNGKYYEGDH